MIAILGYVNKTDLILIWILSFLQVQKRAEGEKRKTCHRDPQSAFNWMALSVLFWRFGQEAVCFTPASLTLVGAHQTQNNGPCRGGPTGEKRVRSLRWRGEEQLSQPPQGPKYWTDIQTGRKTDTEQTTTSYMYTIWYMTENICIYRRNIDKEVKTNYRCIFFTIIYLETALSICKNNKIWKNKSHCC